MNYPSVSVAEWLRKARKKLPHSLSARLDTELLLCHVLGVNKTWLVAHSDKPLTQQHLQHAEKLLKKRQQHVPVAYLVGYKEFYGRSFIVTPDTLIPRPETETLVELAKKYILCKQLHCALDVGTGSGCIGITLALECPNITIALSDKSDAALSVARENAHNLRASNTTFIQSNLLDNLDEADLYDLIIANLPYVDTAWTDTSPDIVHEPASALYAEDSGLALIKQLVDQAPRRLAAHGYLMLEADPTQHEAIVEYAQAFAHAETLDYALVLQLK